jgi:hypothetical protein
MRERKLSSGIARQGVQKQKTGVKQGFGVYSSTLRSFNWAYNSDELRRDKCAGEDLVVLRSALEGTVGRCKPGTDKIRSREVPRLHDPENGGITILRNTRDCSSSDTASRTGTVRSSVKLAGIPTKPALLNITALYVRSPSCRSLTNTLYPSYFKHLGPKCSPTRPLLLPKDSSSQHKWQNTALWDICVKLRDANKFVSQRHQTAEFVAGGSFLPSFLPTPLQVSDDLGDDDDDDDQNAKHKHTFYD